jgi:hypothetical protein
MMPGERGLVVGIVLLLALGLSVYLLAYKADFESDACSAACYPFKPLRCESARVQCATSTEWRAVR